MTTVPDNELVEAVVELRRLFPDWRLGQLIANLTQAAGLEGEGGIWEVEDVALLAAARRLIARNAGRSAVNAGA
jgi:hypothetical protein